MKFFFSISMLEPADYIAVAQVAEASGFDGICVPDSICSPQVSGSALPDGLAGSREYIEGQPVLEPMALLSALAVATDRLRLRTLVYKLPVRNPVLAAKSATTLAVLSGNRFDFGVGLSPWPEDYAVCAERWEARGKRMNDMIDIIRGLALGEYFSFQSEFYKIDPIQLCPVPTQRLPILVGGHSESALRRAALKSDGWLHAGGDEVELQGMIRRLQELREEYGLSDSPFEIQVGSGKARTVEGLQQLATLGVTTVGVSLADICDNDSQSRSVSNIEEALHNYRERVIQPYATC